jgi:hypothetical protein
MHRDCKCADSNTQTFFLMQLREELKAKPQNLHEGKMNRELSGEIKWLKKEAFLFPCVY